MRSEGEPEISTTSSQAEDVTADATGTTPATAGGAGARSGGTPGASLDIVRQPAYGQGIVVSLVIAAAVFVLAIMAIRDAETSGIPLTETTGPLFWGLAILVIAAAGAGAQYSEVTAARAAESLGYPRRESSLPSAWAVPTVATAAAVLLVATHHNRTMLIVGPVIAFLGVAGALLSRDLLDDATEATHRTAATIHALVIHVVGFLAFSGVYLNKLTSWISAPLIGIFAGILIIESLERGLADRTRRIGYAVLGGAIMAEATIALNWWPTYGWTGGGVLLACFYLISGLLLAHTQHDALRRRDIVEFGAVASAALILLAITA
ncbi:MAG TPA: hypothetical protein VIL01_02010 [Thermomicrobiales bacterium]